MTRINSVYKDSQSDVILLCGEQFSTNNIRDRFYPSRNIQFKATIAFVSGNLQNSWIITASGKHPKSKSHKPNLEGYSD